MSGQTSAEDAKFFTCECGGKVSVNARQCPHCGDPDAVNKAYMRGDIVKPESQTKQKQPPKPSFIKRAIKGIIRWLVVFPAVLMFALALLVHSFNPSGAAESGGVIIIILTSILSLALYYLFWRMGKKPDSAEGNKRRDKKFATVAAAFFVPVLVGMYLTATHELTPEQVARMEAKEQKRQEEKAARDAERERIAAAEEEKRKEERAKRKEAERERMRIASAKEKEEAAREAEEEKKARMRAAFRGLGYAKISNNRGGVFRIKTYTFPPQATPQDIRAHGSRETVTQPGFTQVFYYPQGTPSIPHYELSAVQDDGIDAVHSIIRYRLSKGAKWHYVFMHSANGNKRLFDCVKHPGGDPNGVLCPGQL